MLTNTLNAFSSTPRNSKRQKVKKITEKILKKKTAVLHEAKYLSSALVLPTHLNVKAPSIQSQGHFWIG